MQDALRYVALGLLITSVLIQMMGVNALHVMRQSRVIQRDRIAALQPTLIVVDETQGFVPSVMTFLTDKQFLQTGGGDNREALFTRLQEENVPQFVYLTRWDQGVPKLPESSCYEMNGNSSFAECGRGSSCWVFQLTPNCN
jgi:hypothetical protein